MAFRVINKDQRASEVKKRTSRGPAYLSSELPMFTPREGTNTIRIVPPRADDEDADMLGVDILYYYMQGRTYLSPATLDSAPSDPALDAYNMAKQANDEVLQEAINPTRRTLMYILDFADDTENGVMKVWTCPNTVVGEMLACAKNLRTGEIVPIEDPDEGRIIFFERVGTGMSTKYKSFQLDEGPFPLAEELSEEIQTFRSILEIPSVGEIEDIVKGVVRAVRAAKDGGASVSEGRQRPSAGRRRPAAQPSGGRAKAAQAEESDAEEEEVDSTEVEEESDSSEETSHKPAARKQLSPVLSKRLAEIRKSRSRSAK